jgi:2-oxoglutarate ferredoxin oxidoreductase subunit alpha
MSEDIKLALFESGYIRRVEYFGRMGGIIPNPGEVAEAMIKFIKEGDK